MVWQETKVFEEKLMFINDWLRQEYNLATLCKRYQISRPTGYALIKRYQAEGVGAFEARSKAPHHIPHKTSKLIEAELLRLKYRYPNWGPSMIKDFLEMGHVENIVAMFEAVNEFNT